MISRSSQSLPAQVLTGTLDYLRDVVGMQLSQFPLPDINKVDVLVLVLNAFGFSSQCHPVINGLADFLICESFQIVVM